MRQNSDCKNYYEILNEISKCFFGEVYKAKMKGDEVYRAIKIINKNRIRNAYKNVFINDRINNEDEMKKYINCFYNEIKNMKIAQGENEDNENTVKYYECFDTKKEIAIVMELCDDNLKNYLINNGDKLKNEEKYDIINQLNHTFKILVKNKIVFKDLQLDNILLKYDNEKKKNIIKLKITDSSDLLMPLKKAKISSNHNNNFNLLKAPEILNGQHNYEKCDLWSIGVIIYLLYLNDYPFKGTTEIDILNQIKHLDTNLLTTDNLSLNDLIRKLLVEDPKKRCNWNEYFNHPFFIKDFWTRYEKIKNIGGSHDYFTVYKVKDIQNNVYRAIKVYDKKRIIVQLKKQKLNKYKDEDLRPYINGFNNEIKVMQMISENDNINSVKYIEKNETKDEFSIVMELCDENLLNYITNKKQEFSSREIFDILKQLNKSFKIMAEKKIVHRTLNLEHILIKYNNKEKTSYTVKLKLTDDSIILNESFHNIDCQIKGNLNYIAPEILENKNYNYEKCDLWSLGIIIYILLFREFPFSGNKKEILRQIKKKKLKISENNQLNNLMQNLLIEEPKNRLSWDKYFKNYFRYNNSYGDFYDIKQLIGETEYSKVYKAFEKGKKQYRAIKIFDKFKIQNSYKRKNINQPPDEYMKQYIDSFYNEFDYMEEIYDKGNNNNAVKLYEYFDTNEEFSIVMELCDGDLLNYFSNQKKRFDDKTIHDILNQLNNSFKIMVDKKIVHRALNLENILIKINNNNLIYKLKLTNDSCLLNKCSKQPIFNINGNFNYTAPEILRNQNYNEKCDLWSLGVIIYYLAFNEMPYNGDPEFILEQIKTKKLSETNNENLNDLIQKLLTEKQEERINWKQYFDHPFIKDEKKQNYRDYYNIKNRVGAPQYADIYEAQHRTNKKNFAIKIYNLISIKKRLNQNNINKQNTLDFYIKGFYNEYKNMKKLEAEDNNNILKVYEYFQNNDEFIIVMELCDNTLLEFLCNREKGFNSDEILKILIQLNNGFKKMVDNKIVHRDLNLENILVNYENREKTKYTIKLKLTDDSGIIDDSYDPFYNKNLKSINIKYLPPEVLKKHKYYENCDLWSLGIIIYVLYYKEYPYDSEKINVLIKEIENKQLIINTNNKALNDLIKKLLIEEPKKRLTWEGYFKHPFFQGKII